MTHYDADIDIRSPDTLVEALWDYAAQSPQSRLAAPGTVELPGADEQTSAQKPAALSELRTLIAALDAELRHLRRLRRDLATLPEDRWARERLVDRLVARARGLE